MVIEVTLLFKKLLHEFTLQVSTVIVLEEGRLRRNPGKYRDLDASD